MKSPKFQKIFETQIKKKMVNMMPRELRVMIRMAKIKLIITTKRAKYVSMVKMMCFI